MAKKSTAKASSEVKHVLIVESLELSTESDFSTSLIPSRSIIRLMRNPESTPNGEVVQAYITFVKRKKISNPDYDEVNRRINLVFSYEEMPNIYLMLNLFLDKKAKLFVGYGESFDHNGNLNRIGNIYIENFPAAKTTKKK